MIIHVAGHNNVRKLQPTTHTCIWPSVSGQPESNFMAKVGKFISFDRRLGVLLFKISYSSVPWVKYLLTKPLWAGFCSFGGRGAKEFAARLNFATAFWTDIWKEWHRVISARVISLCIRMIGHYGPEQEKHRKQRSYYSLSHKQESERSVARAKLAERVVRMSNRWASGSVLQSKLLAVLDHSVYVHNKRRDRGTTTHLGFVCRIEVVIR